jgi:hypothetical protein
MKKNKFVLTFIALVTFVGGAFAVANYNNLNSLYSFNPDTETYTIIPTYAAAASSFLSTTTLPATYYKWTGSTFSTIAPGTRIYVVTAQ